MQITITRLTLAGILLWLHRPLLGQEGALDEVLAGLDSPRATWEELAPRLHEQGETALERLLSLRPLVEQRTEAASMETRIIATEQLSRLDELIDLVARQPHASVSRLFWHESLPTALDEARRSHRPILVAKLPAHQHRHEAARLFAMALYANDDIGVVLRQRFVLHHPGQSGSLDSPLSTEQAPRGGKPLSLRAVHVVLDASGRPVHALTGFRTPAAFLRWLERAESLANETYQLGDDGAQAIIAQRHRNWSAVAEPAREVQPVLDMQSRALFELERPWFRLGPSGTEEITSLRELETFLEAGHERSMPGQIHQIFAEGIFTRSLAVLEQKLLQGD